MSTLVVILGLSISAMGVVLVIAPDWLRSLLDWGTRAMLWIAAAIRVAFGAVFWLAAPETSAPFAFQVLGGVFVAAGVVLVFLPLSAWHSLVDWALGMPPAAYRVAGVGATLVGLLIAYAA